MERNILEKLGNLQNAHNELGSSYEEIAQSNFKFRPEKSPHNL